MLQNIAKKSDKKAKASSKVENNNRQNSTDSLLRRSTRAVDTKSYSYAESDDVSSDSSLMSDNDEDECESDSKENSKRVRTSMGTSESSNRISTRTRKVPERLDSLMLAQANSKQVSKKKPSKTVSKEDEYMSIESDNSSSHYQSDDSSESSKQNSRSNKSNKSKVSVTKNNNEEEFEYRIQFIIASRKLTAMQWREVCDSMYSQEVTHGSVWTMPDEEYLSESADLVEKFLIKWQHASYLHVSWETEIDLLNIVGPTAKAALNRYRTKGINQFFTEDLRADEYFSPSYLIVERILDVDCDKTNIQTIDWVNATLPHPKPSYLYPKYVPGECDDHGVALNAKPETLGEGCWLHGLSNCFVTIKWEGLSYHDCSFENIHDLRNRNIDYEAAMRSFFKREQTDPTSKLKCTPVNKSIQRKLSADLMSSSVESIPKINGGLSKHIIYSKSDSCL